MGVTGSKVSTLPAATPTKVCTAKAAQAPRMTSRARRRVARIKVASAVLSGSSAMKISPKVDAMTAKEIVQLMDANLKETPWR